MGWRMSKSIWQGEGITYQSTRVGTTRSRETSDHILDSAWKIDGMRPRATWRDRAQGAGYLLSEQEIHRLRVKILTVGKDVLCTSMDNLEAQTVHALPHYLAYCKARSHQIHLWKALTVRKNRKVAVSIIRIWHPIYILEGHQRKCDSRLSHKKS